MIEPTVAALKAQIKAQADELFALNIHHKELYSSLEPLKALLEKPIKGMWVEYEDGQKIHLGKDYISHLLDKIADRNK